MHNHFLLLDKFRKYETTIQDLLVSIMTSLDGKQMLNDEVAQQAMIEHLTKAYPFIELIYSLDHHGIQQQNTVYSPNVSARKRRSLGKGSNRSHRPYFQAARHSQSMTTVTQPYLSSATH